MFVLWDEVQFLNTEGRRFVEINLHSWVCWQVYLAFEPSIRGFTDRAIIVLLHDQSRVWLSVNWSCIKGWQFPVLGNFSTGRRVVNLLHGLLHLCHMSHIGLVALLGEVVVVVIECVQIQLQIGLLLGQRTDADIKEVACVSDVPLELGIWQELHVKNLVCFCGCILDPGFDLEGITDFLVAEEKLISHLSWFHWRCN